MVNIEDMRQLASLNGINRTGVPGKCLSKEYINDKTKLKWQCGKCGYTWETTPHSIKKGRWCGRCAGNIKYTIEDMNKFAKERGIEETGKPGLCISKTYIHNKSNLTWKCGKCGTIWKALPKTVIHQSWCPRCAAQRTESKKERKVRTIFEEIFKSKFPTFVPDWLVNPITKHTMHLDGYNKQYEIAFEYNGKQHYNYNEFFHQENLGLLNQQFRDATKIRLCKQHGIKLIIIPYTVKTEMLKEYIETKLVET